MEAWTIEKLIQTAADYLRRKGSPSPRLDAELLLAKTMGFDRVKLYTEFDRPVGVCTVEHYQSLIARRATHEPVAYILGHAYFRKLCLTVEPAVLIPRPETEELVEMALEVLRRRPPWDASAAPVAASSEDDVRGARSTGPSLVADVGTGSGAIALSIAQEAGLPVVAIDTSPTALKVAAANAVALGLDHLVEFQQADLLCGVAGGSLHLVVSNPPYVTSGDLETLAPDVRCFEPLMALEAGRDGLDVMRRLLPEAARALRPGGTILLEVGYDQAQAVSGLAVEAGFVLTSIHKDLSGKDRIVEATLPGAHTAALAVRPGDGREGRPGDGSALSPAVPLGKAGVAHLREALAVGAILGVPTDTVYGVAARWDSDAGIRRLFTAKGRPSSQPVAVLFASVEAVVQALPDLAGAAVRVLDALLPGPFTFIVATDVPRPDLVGTPDSLGVRVPDHPRLLALLDLLGVPLAATSANLSGAPDARTLADVDAVVLAHCSLAFEDSAATVAGNRVMSAPAGSAPAQASTVVDLRPLARGEAPLVLREGAVSAAAVLARIAALG